MLHAAFLRSPYPPRPHHRHRRHRGPPGARAWSPCSPARTSQADDQALPGGIAAARHQDARRSTPLATDKVRFVGDLVAIVVAESRYWPRTPCELIEVDYDPLPAVADLRRRPRPGRARRSSTTSATTSSIDARQTTATSTPRSPRPTGWSGRRSTSTALANVPMETRGAAWPTTTRRRASSPTTRRPSAPRPAPPPGAARSASPMDRMRVLVRRRRRRLRPEGRHAPRGRLPWPPPAPRAAGEVDRGPQRAPHRVGPGARGDGRGRSRGQRRRRDPRAAGQADHGPGRLPGVPVPGRHVRRPDRHCCSRAPTGSRATRFDATVVATNKCTYVAYRGPVGDGDVGARAAARHRRPRARARPGRGPPQATWCPASPTTGS